MNELMALVKFNSGVALVMKNEIKFKYKKYDNIIIGIDESETFVDCLYYEAPWGRFKAFAGREFDISLENGKIIHCNGQWWHGGSDQAEKILDKKIVGVTVNDIESLKKCYVFTGCFAIKENKDKLIESYHGNLYEYYEYEKELKQSI